MGFGVCACASNGLEALEAIEKENPDVVVIDIKMPTMDGIELCKILYETKPRIKKIILSGYEDFEYAQKAIEYNVNAYLLKPLNEKKLFEELRKLKTLLDSEKAEEMGKINNRILLENNIKMHWQLLGFKLINSNFIPDANLLGFADGSILNISIENTCIIAATIQNEKSGVYLTDKYLNACMDYWTKMNYPVFLDNNILVILPNSNTKLFQKQIIYEANEFKEWIDLNIESVTLNAGIGSFVPFKDINKSKTEAYYTLDYTFFKNKGTILTVSDIRSDISNIILKAFKKDRKLFDFDINIDIDKDIDKDIEKDIDKDIDKDKDRIKSKLHEAFILAAEGFIDKMFEEKFKNFTIDLKHFFDEILLAGINNRLTVFLRCVEVYILFVKRINDRKFSIEYITTDELYTKISRSINSTELLILFNDILLNMVNQILAIINDEDSFIIQKIKAFIKSNFNTDLSLNKLAEEFFLNPSYLSTYFKKETGITISEYITKVRVNNSKELLKNLDLPIYNIAEKVGYSDYRYFCTVFKKLCGVSPLQYRLNELKYGEIPENDI